MTASMASLPHLDAAVRSAQALWTRLAASLDTIYKNPSSSASSSSSSGTPPPPPNPPPPDVVPLDLARDAATLVRAHATKLGLLAVTRPFTASAVLDVLAQLQQSSGGGGSPTLGLAAAPDACDPARYTASFRKELAWRCRRVLLVLADLLDAVVADAGRRPAAAPTADDGSEARLSLQATGKVWAACDDVLALVAGGVSGHLARRVDEWRDSLGDVMEELKEWGEQEPDDDDDDNGSDAAHESNLDAQHATSPNQAMLDHLMSPGRPIPVDDPQGIRPRLDSTLRRLRLVVLLYQAVNKRRFRNLPPFPLPDTPPAHATLPERLDEVARVLGGLPGSFDDLADAFYGMDPAVIDKSIDECFFAAFAAGELLSASWDGSQDEFSDWVERFKTGIKKS